MTFTEQPATIDLFGTNPRWLEVEQIGSLNKVRLILYQWKDGAWSLVGTLYNYFRENRAAFNLSKMLELGYDLPSREMIEDFEIKTAERVLKKYKIEVSEINHLGTAFETIEMEAIALRGGQDVLMNRVEEFTTNTGSEKRFLTLHPSTKIITPMQPEFLYYYLEQTETLRHVINIKVYFSDDTEKVYHAPGNAAQSGNTLPGGGTTTAYYPILSDENPAGAFYQTTESALQIFAVGFEQLDLQQLESPSKYILKYDFWIDSHVPGDGLFPSVGTKVFSSEKRTFEMDFDLQSWEHRYFLFQNPLGGMDTLCTRGKAELVSKQKRETRSIYERPGMDFSQHPTRSLAVDSEREMKVNIGWIERPEREWCEDLANSTDVWQIDLDQGNYHPILITSTSIPIHADDEPLQSSSFTFKYPKRNLR